MLKFSWKLLKYPKVCCFYFLNRVLSTIATYNMGYMHVFCVFWRCSEKSQNVCWDFLEFFLKYTKVCCFYFFKDSAIHHRNIVPKCVVKLSWKFLKFHRNIYYILYASKKCACFKNFRKNSKSQNVCRIFLEICLSIQKCVVFTS